MSRWYKAYVGTAQDSKIAEIAFIAEVSRSVAIATWHVILEAAAEAQEDGRFTTTARRIAVLLGEPPAALERVLSAMIELGLIEDGKVAKWDQLRSNDRPPASVWVVIREAVFARDDFTCAYCGSRGGRLECDHIVPVSRGGGHEDSNLTTACFTCNRSKRDKLVSEWRPQ